MKGYKHRILLKLTNWEVNVIQVGLNHIQDEFEFLTLKQNRAINLIIEGLDWYCKEKKDKSSYAYKKGFGVEYTLYGLLTMATTEIYIMHTDLKIQAQGEYYGMDDEDKEFSVKVVKTCNSLFKKLLGGG